jgi:trehalose 6-phosphate synthase/phosphatase
MPKGAKDTLVVLSNRLPITLRRERGSLRADASSGGLVSALRPALHRQGGTWIGWPGVQLKGRETRPQIDPAIELVPVLLSPTEVKRYYHGFSTRTLWPLFHSLPERAQFDRREWDCYEVVNRRFADAAETACRDGQLVWIHDYHLLRTAAPLRERVPDARLAFFLHIPFPPFDLFRVLPWSRALLEGVLACDLIGFHSPGYVSNFLDTAERLLGARIDRASGQVELGERTTRVAAFPLGIDYTAYEKLAHGAPRKTPTEQVILGVDRLDYTKGIPERISAFERFLELFPEHREKVVFIQLAVPSRDQVAAYQELKRSIDEHVGRVNGRFGTSTWTPIRYLYRSVSPERLSALYRDADVALVTPLRDGMNLVAKEFVACQVDDPGVLILSRLAGAAETMREALQVNPYDTDNVALKLHQALTMPVADRMDRITALQARERRRDVNQWLDGFLASALEPRSRFRPTTEAEFDAWLGDYLRGRPLALFLDYDGTLAPIAGRPEEAAIPDPTLDVLRRCAARNDTDITIVSGRSILDIGKRVGLDTITYAGNHGLEIHGPGVPDFVHADVRHFQGRAQTLAKALRALRVAGAQVEEKGASLTFHYRRVPKRRWPDAIARVEACILEAGFQARGALCAIEARPPIGWDKGHAVLHILRTRYGPSWSQDWRVIYAGDDSTDEDAFRSLQGLGVSFRVGGARGSSRATRRLPNPEAIYTLLEWLAARPTVA